MKALGVKIDEPLDIVIANAGVPEDSVGSFGSLDYEAFGYLLTVNTLGPVATLEAFAPHLKKAKGKFAAISSVLGSIENASGYAAPYSTSKAGLNMAIKAFAPPLQKAGVAVNPFHPGWVKTDMGGADAAVEVEDSVRGLRAEIEKMEAGAPVRLLDYQGSEIGW